MKTYSVTKWTALAVLGVTAFASSTQSHAAPNAAAGDGGARREWRGKGGFGGQKLAEKLNLTDAQRSQIQSIMQRARTDAQAVKNNTSLSDEQKKAQLRTIHTNVRDAIDGVLTPAQRAQLAQIRRDARQKGGRHGGKRGRGGFDGAKLAEKLNLSLSQQTQIAQIRQRAQADSQALRNNTSLTPEQKRAQFKTIRTNAQNAIENVLTPAQRAQWAEIKAQRKENRGERRGNRQNARQDRQGGGLNG